MHVRFQDEVSSQYALPVPVPVSVPGGPASAPPTAQNRPQPHWGLMTQSQTEGGSHSHSRFAEPQWSSPTLSHASVASNTNTGSHHRVNPNPQETTEKLMEWEHQRRQRLEEKRTALQRQLEADVTGKPTISKLAAQLPVESDPVEIRLQQYGEKIKERQRYLQERQLLEMRQNAAPKLESTHSAALHRDGDVSERLYNLASKQRQEKKQAQETPPLVAQHDVVTGQRLFEPKIVSKHTEKLAKNARNPQLPIEESLHSRGLEYQMKAKWRQQSSEIQAQMLRETSKINPVSEKIVRDREIAQGEKTADRLMKPIGSVRKSTLETISNPSFKPQINKKSQEMVQFTTTNPSGANGGNAGHRYSSPTSFNSSSNHSNQPYESSGMDLAQLSALSVADFESPAASLRPSSSYSHSSPSQLYNNHSSAVDDDSHNSPVNAVYARSQKWATDKAKRLEKERLQREQRLQQECSFRPNLADNRSFVATVDNVQYTSNSTTQHNSGTNGGTDIADRQIEWLKKREQRLEAERQKKELEAMEGCSFVPNIAKHSNSSISTSKPRQSNPSNSFDDQSSATTVLKSRQMPPPPPPPPPTSSRSTSAPRGGGNATNSSTNHRSNSNGRGSSVSVSPGAQSTAASRAEASQANVGQQVGMRLKTLNRQYSEDERMQIIRNGWGDPDESLALVDQNNSYEYDYSNSYGANAAGGQSGSSSSTIVSNTNSYINSGENYPSSSNNNGYSYNNHNDRNPNNNNSATSGSGYVDSTGRKVIKGGGRKSSSSATAIATTTYGSSTADSSRAMVDDELAFARAYAAMPSSVSDYASQAWDATLANPLRSPMHSGSLTPQLQQPYSPVGTSYGREYVQAPFPTIASYPSTFAGSNGSYGSNNTAGSPSITGLPYPSKPPPTIPFSPQQSTAAPLAAAMTMAMSTAVEDLELNEPMDLEALAYGDSRSVYGAVDPMIPPPPPPSVGYFSR